MTVIRLRTEEDRAVAVRFLQKLDLRVTPRYELELREEKVRRSSEQNRRYWAVLTEIADQSYVNGQKFDRETWHTYFKQAFLGWDEIAGPFGTIREPISTTSLSVGQFANYMTEIEAFATECGVVFGETKAYLEQWAQEGRAWWEAKRQERAVV